MKKLNKKWIIILSILLVVVIITAAIFIIKNKNQQIQTQENTYEALVSINPMIKLELKEVCQSDEEGTSCQAKVTNYELINDDAKNIYSDLDFSKLSGSHVFDAIVMLAEKARENGIVFDTVHISSDWKGFLEYERENGSLDGFKLDINIVNKEKLEELEKDQPVYDLNLNDNIMYRVLNNYIYKRAGSTCAEQFLGAGYEYWDHQTLITNDTNGILIEKFPSCFNPVPQSTINELKKIKGLKVVDNEHIHTVSFNVETDANGDPVESKYSKYGVWYDKSWGIKYNIMTYGLGGWVFFEPQLLDEKACQEYNLSCGRW